MTEKKRKNLNELEALIPKVKPDDPLFKRGWIIGGHRGGTQPKPVTTEKSAPKPE